MKNCTFSYYFSTIVHTGCPNQKYLKEIRITQILCISDQICDCELKQEMCLRAENFLIEKFDFGHPVNISESAFRDFKKVSQALSKIQLQLKLSTHSILQRKVNFQSLKAKEKFALRVSSRNKSLVGN